MICTYLCLDALKTRHYLILTRRFIYMTSSKKVVFVFNVIFHCLFTLTIYIQVDAWVYYIYIYI